MPDETNTTGTTSLGGFEYGPLQTYEVTWTSGHVEKIRCHQVSYSGGSAGLDVLATIGLKTQQGDRRIHLHGMIDRHWRLILSAREDDIASLRLVTAGEEFAGSLFTLDDSADQGGAK